MALIRCDYFSEALGMGASMDVILPQPRLGDPASHFGSGGGGGEGGGGGAIGIDHGPAGVSGQLPGGGYPTLWLLHGLSDDHTAWCRRTSIERYVSGMNLAVVMPGVGRSYYADMAFGQKYWTLLSEELPRVCRGMFRLSERREDNFAAGLSMGGFAAFKLALNHPDRYAAAASLSGALDPIGLLELRPDRRREWAHIFGDPPAVRGTTSDLFEKASELAAGEHAGLPLYACCGTADFIYGNTTSFRDHARSLGLNLTCEEHEGRDHEWGYWDEQIQRVLAWLPLPPSAPPGLA